MPDENAKPASGQPNPFVRALFLDIPYVIDSIWRWSEFRANRLGRVSLAEPHDFEIRPLRYTPIFALFIAISACLIFGFTFDSLCTGLGLTGANIVRIAAGVILGLITLRVLVGLLEEIFQKLSSRAREAQHLCRDVSHESAEAVETSATAQFRVSRGFRGAFSLSVRALAALPRLGRSFVTCIAGVAKLPPGTRGRVTVALIGLVIGALISVAPFILSTVTLLTISFDPVICYKDASRAYSVFAQIFALIALVVVVRFVWLDSKPAHAFRNFLIMTALWTLVTAVLWIAFMPPNASEAAGGVYPHVYALILGCLMLIAIIARYLARLAFRRVDPTTSERLRARLKTRELITYEREDPPVSKLRILAAVVNGICYHPFHVLLLPSLVSVMTPTGNQLAFTSIAAFVAILVLTYGSLSTRWEQLVLYVQRWFLSGTPRFVSLVVIALSLMRLMGVQYVATVLDAAPFGVIFVAVLLAYATFWMYEFWINRWIAERLLAVLGAPNDGRDGYMDYVYVPPDDKSPINAELTDRKLSLHGTGRFCAQGWIDRKSPRPWERQAEHGFGTYGLIELFEVISHGNQGAIDATNDVARRLRFYFGILNIVLVLGLGALLLWQNGWQRPLASYRVVDAKADALPEADHGDLAALLARQAQNGRPAIFVAASGGGTRAALYTATALEGLSRLGRAEDVVLLSGVSGGGVAVTYFASHFDRLKLEHDTVTKDWNKFRKVITEPFIQDVLEGMGEVRVAADVPLGQLLVESLSRRALDLEDRDAPMRTFRSLGALPLILNTTMSGHPRGESVMLAERVGVVSDGDSCIEKAQPFAALSGGRLIFTNLYDTRGFPGRDSAMPDVRMDYRVVRDLNVPLAAAAALNANFPPVFSNARVRLTDEKTELQAAGKSDVCNAHSYFVTDGGATENLGLVSALYALRRTVKDWPNGQPLPELHLVAIEASAVTYDYSQDRGVGAATGGSKERINGGLTQELIESVNALLAQRATQANTPAMTLHVHYLPLPMAFRSRGGFGTHWMYAKEIRVSNPLLPKLPRRYEQYWGQRLFDQAYYVVLDQPDVDSLWHAMYSKDVPFCDATFKNENQERAAAWVCGIDHHGNAVAKPDYQIEAWQGLIATIGASATAEKQTPQESQRKAEEAVPVQDSQQQAPPPAT